MGVLGCPTLGTNGTITREEGSTQENRRPAACMVASKPQAQVGHQVVLILRLRFSLTLLEGEQESSELVG